MNWADKRVLVTGSSGFLGKYVVGSSMPYDYLVKSINDFYTQKELTELIKKSGFSNIEYRNLSGGISAIHSGWKI